MFCTLANDSLPILRTVSNGRSIHYYNNNWNILDKVNVSTVLNDSSPVVKDIKLGRSIQYNPIENHKPEREKLFIYEKE